MPAPDYGSTRGGDSGASFDDVLLTGLATDGGLYTPFFFPALSKDEWAALAGAPYKTIAASVIGAFVENNQHAALHHAIDQAYHRFGHRAVAPFSQLGPDDFLLELYHGPTLAFKDVAMQLLGPLFDEALTRKNRQLTIVAATSGDTGGAAIAAMAGRPSVSTCILHPKGRISEVQRRFMTTVGADNVLNIAVEGTFDDCQALVKAMFADQAFKEDISLGAVNSINWARIVAQTVYFVSTSLHLARHGRKVSFCVPTGNFGDVFAGYVAKQMGAPIGTLIVATNTNDILTRVLKEGEYRPSTVVPTDSPSMDIQVSSNFERLLYLALERDGPATADLMAALKSGEGFTVPGSARQQIAKDFIAERASEEETAEMIGRMLTDTGRLIDPHTAVGLVATEKARKSGAVEGPIVTLATAHPAKFPDAVERACGQRPALPRHVEGLFEKEEAYLTSPADLHRLMAMIRERFAR